MADDAVQVKFGADIAALQTGTTGAKSEIMKVVEAIAILQKSVHATSQMMTSELTAAIRGMGTQATVAAPQIQKMSQAVASLSTAGHAGHGTIFGMQSGVFLELRALLDEALAGRMRNFEGSFARLMGMLGPTIGGFVTANPLLTAFGVAALAAGGSLAYLVYQTYETNKAIKGIEFDAALQQFNITRAASEELIASVQKLGNVSASNAREFIEPFLKLGPVGEAISAISSQYLPLFVANGKTAKEAGEELAKSFIDISKGGGEAITNSRVLSEEEKRTAQAFIAAGDKVSAYKFVIDILSRSLSSVAGEQRKAREETEQMQGAIAAGILGAETLGGAEQILGAMTSNATQRTREQEEELARWGMRAAMATDQAERLGAAMRDAMKVDRVSSEINDLKGKVKEFQDALGKTKDPESIAQLNRSLVITKEHLKDLQNQSADPIAGENRGDLAQYEEAQQLKAAKSRATQQQILTDEITSNRAKLADANLTEKEKQQLTLETAQKERQLFDMNTKAGTKASNDQRGATEAELNGEIAHIEAQTQHTIAQLDMQVKIKQITEDKKASLAIAALKKEETAVDALFAKELALAGLTLTKKQEITDKQLAYDDRAAKEIFAQQAAAAEASAKVWDSASKTINSAFDSQVNGLLRGTTSWGQALKNVLASLTEDIIKFFLNWGLQAVENQAKQIALQASGVAAQKAMNASAITSDAGKAAAGAYSAVAGIPLIGPVLAPAAAAVAFGAVEAFGSYDIGSWSLPGDTIARVHQGEMIVPAQATPWAQSLMANAANGGGGGGGGGGYNHYGDIISNAADARQVAREVASLWNRNPSMRPAY